MKPKGLANDFMVRIEKEMLRTRNIIPSKGFLFEEGLFCGPLASVALQSHAVSQTLLLIWFVLSARRCLPPTVSANYPP